MRELVLTASAVTVLGFACYDAVGFPDGSADGKSKVGRPSLKAEPPSLNRFRQQLEQTEGLLVKARDNLQSAERDAKTKRDAVADASERELSAFKRGRQIDVPGTGFGRGGRRSNMGREFLEDERARTAAQMKERDTAEGTLMKARARFAAAQREIAMLRSGIWVLEHGGAEALADRLHAPVELNADGTITVIYDFDDPQQMAAWTVIDGSDAAAAHLVARRHNERGLALTGGLFYKVGFRCAAEIKIVVSTTVNAARFSASAGQAEVNLPATIVPKSAEKPKAAKAKSRQPARVQIGLHVGKESVVRVTQSGIRLVTALDSRTISASEYDGMLMRPSKDRSPADWETAVVHIGSPDRVQIKSITLRGAIDPEHLDPELYSEPAGRGPPATTAEPVKRRDPESATSADSGRQPKRKAALAREPTGSRKFDFDDPNELAQVRSFGTNRAQLRAGRLLVSAPQGGWLIATIGPRLTVPCSFSVKGRFSGGLFIVFPAVTEQGIEFPQLNRSQASGLTQLYFKPSEAGGTLAKFGLVGLAGAADADLKTAAINTADDEDHFLRVRILRDRVVMDVDDKSAVLEAPLMGRLPADGQLRLVKYAPDGGVIDLESIEVNAGSDAR